MKVVSILGGLGSQMQKYAFFLMLQRKTDQKCYIDTTYFLQRTSWNGYELDRIFNISAPDMRNILPKDAIENIQSKKSGYLYENLRYLCLNNKTHYYFLGNRHSLRKYSQIVDCFRIVKHKYLMLKLKFGKQEEYPDGCFSEMSNSYFDDYLMKSDVIFREVKDDVLEAFRFPDFQDEKNLETAKKMLSGNSVAIHVRRTDHLGDNGRLYDRKYYAKSVNFIRDNCSGVLSFYVFSDDIQWCKSNLVELGLTPDDEITFVDWNTGMDSYKDMQLMTCCQHNVLAISSFSWWGYYLSEFADKIVCAPHGYWTEVQNHF